MRRLHVCLSLTLALVLLAGGAGLPAPGAAGDAPAGFAPAGWKADQFQVTKLAAADGTSGDGFGTSVSVDGNTVVIGAEWAEISGKTDQGAAYVFYRDQGGAWGQVAKLTALDGAAGDRLGAVTISGDTAVVGAFQAGVGGNSDQGAAYVFYRNQGGPDAWGQVAKLIAADGAADDWFGCSVSVSGDTALVGAHLADVGGNVNRGAAYVFYRNQGGPDAWGQVAKLAPAGAVGEQRFGSSVSIDGDTAVVAAYYTSAAYVFSRDEGGGDAWGQVVELIPADGPAGSFGSSVSIDGDTAVVGGTGVAYVFSKGEGGADAWGQVARLAVADGSNSDGFGGSASVSGDIAVIGAYNAIVGTNYYQGAAYAFYRDQGGADAWGQGSRLIASDGQWGDNLGLSVSVSGDTAIAGAYAAPPGGAAYLYRLLDRRTYLPMMLRHRRIPGWQTIVSTDFEGDFPGPWEVVDGDGGKHGLYYWAKRDCRPYAGSYSGWAVGGGDGAGLPCKDNYPDYAYSWMIYGPFSLEEATAGDLTFALWLKSEEGYDGVVWAASVDGEDFYGYPLSGTTGGWVWESLDLSSVPDIGSVLGRPQVWVALVFISDVNTNLAEGCYVDNIVLRKFLGSGAAPEGAAVPSLPPGGRGEPIHLSLERLIPQP